MNILQIASFDGNIGDIANHTGFQISLRNAVEDKCVFTNMEMRLFYKSWGERSFDESFARYANQFDLLVLGGGGFFNLKWKYSSTGTTVDIDRNILDQIKAPILFNGMGYSDEEADNELKERFSSFLYDIVSRDNIFLTVRNDGSHQRLVNSYGERNCSIVHKVPDGGFFCRPTPTEHPELDHNSINVAVNLAGDAIARRFPGASGLHDLDSFTKEFASFVTEFLGADERIRIIFVPHIFSDLKIVSAVMEKIPDRLVRKRITCSAYLNGVSTDGLLTFDLYRNCDLVIGMRYHANVVPIGLSVPTIAIFTRDDHIGLYEDLGIMQNCIPANQRGFSRKLLEKCLDAIKNREQYVSLNRSIMERLRQENDEYMRSIIRWLGMKK